MTAWEILVIDDSPRFPLHVWRYLTRCLGFGIGDVGIKGVWTGLSSEKGEQWISEYSENSKEPLRSEDGRYQIWWVYADNETQTKLDEIFRSRFDGQSRVYTLVDVHGKRGSSYRAQEICAWLERKRTERAGELRIRPVSAYQSGHRITVFPVLPKSRETLGRMVRELGAATKDAKSQEGVTHILVTGAGFEIRARRGGFGMPSTREILKNMGSPLDPADLGLIPPDSSETAKEAFPVPSEGIWRSSGASRLLKKFALARNLDTYWDYLLEQELQHRLGTLVALEDPEDREAGKAGALWRERALREAFRRSMLRHDWGHMNQSLDAARLPLHAWLTTNYTQFADRAISLYGDADRDRGMWRFISTAAEARTVTREGVGPPGQKARYLFKLHGDIAHLQTMAIAGHDKERFSPLSMPVEDLYEIYAAAERFLIDSLRAVRLSLTVWHIVGHGLQDRRLCSLLAWVSSHLPDETAQVFAVVNPQPREPVELLKKSLGETRPLRTIRSCELEAADYMARLHQFLRADDQELPEVRQEEKMLQWLDAVAPRPGGQGLF
jgi:hypothetical protein